MKKILIENEKYRIVKTATDTETGTLVTDFHDRHGMHCQIKLGPVVAMLEEKRSVFLFWPSWYKIGYTNIAGIVQEWMTKYFDGAKLWNGPGSPG